MKSHEHNFKQAQTTLEFLLGPIRVKDGLFIGDQLAAKDIEFIISNKVTHVINTVSKIIPNLYERFGIQYLSVHWTERQQNIFDKKNNAVNAIYSFIEEAMSVGESCLIHSVNGKSRASAVLIAYLMKKYSWSLKKCLDFVKTKKEGLQVRPNFLLQLQELERRMLVEFKLSESWNQIKNQQDLVLANTYYNAKKLEPVQGQPNKKTAKKRVTWNEKLVQKTSTNNMTTTLGRFREVQEPIKTPQSINIHSILKGQEDTTQLQEGTINFQQKQIILPEERIVSNINGNIVHVTVNNFINTDKKPTQTPTKMYNTRPYSSDAKDRDKKQVITGTRPSPFDNSVSSTLKNPYQTKLVGKINTIKNQKKREEIKNPIMNYERPISANINGDKKKIKPNGIPNPLTEKLGFDMMVTGSTAKKRYPSSNPKQDSFKIK